MLPGAPGAVAPFSRFQFSSRNANAMLTPRSIRETNKRYLDEAIQAGFSLAQRHLGVPAAFERLLLRVHEQTDLLRPRRKCGDRPGNGRCALVAGLFALALHHPDWLHPVEAWKPATASAWPQFTSLAQHFFAHYPIPAFMTSAWFELPPGEKLIYHEWYKQIGLGVSIRKLNLPIALSTTMAHCFLQAPDHYAISSAFRWGQVRGMGGSEELRKPSPQLAWARSLTTTLFGSLSCTFSQGIPRWTLRMSALSWISFIINGFRFERLSLEESS